MKIILFCIFCVAKRFCQTSCFYQASDDNGEDLLLLHSPITEDNIKLYPNLKSVLTGIEKKLDFYYPPILETTSSLISNFKFPDNFEFDIDMLKYIWSFFPEEYTLDTQHYFLTSLQKKVKCFVLWGFDQDYGAMDSMTTSSANLHPYLQGYIMIVLFSKPSSLKSNIDTYNSNISEKTLIPDISDPLDIQLGYRKLFIKHALDIFDEFKIIEPILFIILNDYNYKIPYEDYNQAFIFIKQYFSLTSKMIYRINVPFATLAALYFAFANSVFEDAIAIFIDHIQYEILEYSSTSGASILSHLLRTPHQQVEFENFIKALNNVDVSE